MSWTGEALELAQQVLELIADGGAWREAQFERIALRMHRWQRANDPVLDALTDDTPRRWIDIPSVPVALFKDLPVGTVHPDDAAATFLTSGTTGGGRGAHRLRSTRLYDRGALRWARECMPDAPADSVNLLLDPASHPESSLSHMVHLFRGWSTPPGSASWHLKASGLDIDGFVRAVRSAAGPIFVGSTAFALAEVLQTPDLPALPHGSVLMITGGFKGRDHQLSDAELYDAAQRRLQPLRIVTEYGMTELSSQLWGAPGQAYRPPPWMRVVAVDPATQQPVSGPGQLRFFDLCNLDSTVAVETMDEGIVHADGSVTLLGRLTDAPVRGCSLTVEEAWAARS